MRSEYGVDAGACTVCSSLHSAYCWAGTTPRMRFGLGPLGVVRAKVLWQSDRIHSQTDARRNADQAQTKGARLAGGWS